MADFGRGKYDQFFDVNEKYFPCIDDSAIAGGARWDTTYPHATFVKLLRAAENMLGGSTNRSVWIHGAYGTGKSQCAFTLKKVLEVPEEELKTYWERYDTLRKESDLLTKLLGHRDRGIVTAYRYATGGITTPQKFFAAVQESVREALTESDRVTYMGENTLKENVIAWIEDPAHKRFFGDLLEKPEWMAKFSQSNADEVLNTLKKSSDIKELMSNIFELADKEGITAMNLDADKLKNWLKDVIEQNHIKIVFFWDEFSKFFENNKYSLDEFQKVVALCQESPFYLVIVTHQAGSIIDDQDESWKVVQQRFEKVEITLPDNIAFDLIGHAFQVKSAAKETWNNCADTLNSRLSDSRNAVMKAANIKEQKVIKDIMPIHPMAALVLKNIASAFASNQRSMFDFIKVRDDSQAFQWFISNYGPDDDYPLLTIDMLWDFFYEKGKDNLSPDIRMILDAFPQQKNLRDDQQRVLKTILIMQAIDKRLHGEIDILKPTEQNISYAFEGISSGLDSACKNLAKQLCKSGVLVQTPIGNNKFAYGVAVLAGDQAKINEYKKSIRNSSSTASLVSDGKLGTCLSLNPALKLRFAEDNSGQITPVTINDFTKTVNTLKNRQENWHFNTVIAFAKDSVEGSALREKIKAAIVSGDYDNILVIDATASPLGDEDFDAYIEYSAMANYYQGNNNLSARDNSKKAEQVLSIIWKNRIYNGTFTIWNKDYVDGEKVAGGTGVADILQTVVLRKFKYVPDFCKGLTESQFKLTNAKAAALCGINQKTSGVVAGVEKSILVGVWNVADYWTKPETSRQSISVIKSSIEELIREKFENDKPVPVSEVYEHLVSKYGYAQSNLTAFLLGFLLKEYSQPQFRYIDQNGANGEMTPDKLAELIANCISKETETYIVKMTPDERAFYEVTEKAWGIPENTLSSPVKAAAAVKSRMQMLGLPVWCLKSVDNDGVYDIVSKYIELVQKEGADTHLVANEIGAEARKNTSLTDSLKSLLTTENCRKGILKFIDCFDGGQLRILADKIGANDDRLLTDIGRLFSVEYSSLWNFDTGEDQIRKLIVDYTYVKATNDILHAAAHSKKDADSTWHEKLKFVMCSCEALQEEYPNLKGTLEFLRKIYLDLDILPEQMKSYTDEFVQNTSAVEGYLSNEIPAFAKIYAPYLEGLTDEDMALLRTTELAEVFKKSKTESNAIVRRIADEFRKNQTKTQLFKLWKDNTTSKTPMAWSAVNRTPILAIVPKAEYDSAKKTFDILNRGNASESELKEALGFLGKTTIFVAMKNKEKVDTAFRSILGTYKKILTDIDRVRDVLETLPVETYDWGTHPSVQEKIRELAKAEYDSGASDMAIAKINAMGRDELKEHLISLIKENMTLGIEIINGGE
ncbi:hypothetical protein [Clostridium sp. FS41]|uniref:hypothetical protein n=1 Tax=Clostridium sp. FS41 TaxID=1609975 RepID=UPI0005D446AD|nr:hypothetical protein [Clostridium sp. FS41]KJJ74456.1 hypothetical protein CLFS41_11860 [Clostridium sp. FS41]